MYYLCIRDRLQDSSESGRIPAVIWGGIKVTLPVVVDILIFDIIEAKMYRNLSEGLSYHTR